MLTTWYLIALYNAADIFNLEDLQICKEELNIVNTSCVTLGKPLKMKGLIYI